MRPRPAGRRLRGRSHRCGHGGSPTRAVRPPALQQHTRMQQPKKPVNTTIPETLGKQRDGGIGSWAGHSGRGLTLAVLARVEPVLAQRRFLLGAADVALQGAIVLEALRPANAWETRIARECDGQLRPSPPRRTGERTYHAGTPKCQPSIPRSPFASLSRSETPHDQSE